MKVKYIKTVLLFAVLSIAGCKIDNYPAPASSLSGNIVDAVTGAKVPEQTLNGGLVQLYQIGYSSNAPNPINSAMHSDGSYNNNLLFDGTYKLVATGPFTYTDTLNVTVKGHTVQDIKVIPNLTVTAVLASKTSTSITLTVNIAQSAAASSQQIARVGAIAGITNSLDVNNYAARTLVNTESMTNADAVAQTYSIVLTGLNPGTTYYVRGGSRTINNGNFYNYAPVFQVTTDK